MGFGDQAAVAFAVAFAATFAATFAAERNLPHATIFGERGKRQTEECRKNRNGKVEFA